MSDREQIARHLRRNGTDAETRLWRHLRDRRLQDCKFRRQHPIGRYIADFACPERRIVIELDGGQHAEREALDAARTAELGKLGYRVLRFWNHDVLANLDGVLEAIAKALQSPSPRPLPRKRGRG